MTATTHLVMPRHPIKATQWQKHGDHPRVRELRPSELWGGRHDPDNTCGALDGTINPIFVRPGDWVVEEMGSFSVMRDSYFNRIFRICDDNAPAPPPEVANDR